MSCYNAEWNLSNLCAEEVHDLEEFILSRESLFKFSTLTIDFLKIIGFEAFINHQI